MCVRLGQPIERERCNLGKALDRFVPGRDRHDEMGNQVVDHVRVEDELQRDPAQVRIQRLETGLHQRGLHLVLEGGAEHLVAKRVDGLELLGHLGFQMLGLRLQNLLLSKVKNLFTHDSQDVESVLTLLLRLLGVAGDLRNEVDPGRTPFKLNDADQCSIQFSQQKLVLLRLIVREVQHHLHQTVPDRILVRVLKSLPPSLHTNCYYNREKFT